MKKEEILKLFPDLLSNQIKLLPEEIITCWYPSSGAGCDSQTLNNFYGYNIINHWNEQPSKLKPNLFIFSDISEFIIHADADVLFSKTYFEDPITTFFNNVDTIDYSLFPTDHHSSNKNYINDITHLYTLGLIEDTVDDLIQKIKMITSSIEKENSKLILKILLDSELVSKDTIIEKLKTNEENTEEEALYGQLKKVSVIKYLDSYFILVQGSNEFLYNRLIEENIMIPILTLNRPMDPFIFNHGIDIEKLGIQEFIAGRNYVSSLVYGEEFKKYPDFIFQTYRHEHIDMANLYSKDTVPFIPVT